MGAAADAAKKNSNFLKLAKGETMVLEFDSYKIIPSNLDPTKDVIQVKFRTQEFGDKYWTNGNSAIMMTFDTMERGTKLRLTRGPWINKDGTEDTGKSSYAVQVIDKEDPAAW